MIKKKTIVKDLENLEYNFPYKFENICMNIKYYDDYKKYKSKLHIKPKTYTKEGDPDLWDCSISFEKVPKKGKMIIKYY